MILTIFLWIVAVVSALASTNMIAHSERPGVKGTETDTRLTLAGLVFLALALGAAHFA